MATVIGGPIGWKGRIDDEGHRLYEVRFRVRSSESEGPAAVMNATGLYPVGAAWVVEGDADTWAWCQARLDVERDPHYRAGAPGRYWIVTQYFTTRPPRHDRCQNQAITNPLLEPPRISGQFVTYSEEAGYDRNGQPILSSSHERLSGPELEFETGYPTVAITINQLTLDLPLITQMHNTVNAVPMWGLPKRCVRLSRVTWERKLYGTCSFYFQITYEFEIRYGGHDRLIADRGSKVLNGHWDESTGEWTLDKINGSDPDPNNPAHFIQAVDRKGNPVESILLDGTGKPLTDINNPHFINVEYYQENNFFLLGIPATLS